MLALSYASKSAHQPFFARMFAALRKVGDREDLVVPLRQFLDSPAVNDRTDDDKTLVLATRGHLASGQSVDSVSLYDSGGALGRLSVLRSRVALHSNDALKHVHPYRPRCGRRVRL
jgi:hypothetical protein